MTIGSKLFIGAGVAASVFLSVFFTSNQANAAFDPNNIVDNAIFDSSQTMSTSDIQNFLNGFPNSCLKSYSSAYPISYSEYGQNTSAATIIRRSADLWGLNPQVILTTLEKEQSLVSGNAGCPEWKYNSAMGMGCPDNGACPAPAYAGFSKQVTKGSWQLMFNRQRSEGNTAWNGDGSVGYYSFMTAGYRARTQGGSSAYYDGYITIDSSKVYLSNGATASLYSYTPHFHGNQNFVIIFERWFGLTKGTKIIKKADDSTFYLLNKGTKQKIPNGQVYNAYGFNKVLTTTVSDSYFNSVPTGNDLTTLARDAAGNIQLMTNGDRYTLTADTCAAWGLQCFNPYVVTDLDPDMFMYSTWRTYLPYIMNNSGTTYKMVNGKKLPLLNQAAITENGLVPSQVVGVENINASQPLGELLPSDMSALRLSNGNIVLYVDNQLVLVGLNQFYAWKLDSIYYPLLPASSWDSSPPPVSSTLTTNFISFSKYKIIIDNGRKIDLSSAYNEWPAATEANPYMGKLLNRLPLITATPGSCFRSEDGDLYTVKAAQRRSFALYDDLYRYGCRPESLIGLYNSSASMINRGSIMLTSNRMFKKANSPDIFMETGASSSVAVPSYAYINAFGQRESDIALVDDATLSQYPVQGQMSSVAGIEGTGTYYLLGSDRSKFYFNSDVFSAWGINKNSIPNYSTKPISGYSASPATVFARLPDGTIYYANGGKSYKLNNYSAFTSRGGNSSNTMNVLEDFISKSTFGGSIN